MSRRRGEAPEVALERRLRRWVRAEGRHYEPAVLAAELDRRGAGDLDTAARGRLERQHLALRILDAGEGAWQ